MASLLKRCWSHKAEDRPSFDEIFKKLSSDFSMLGEDVDEDEVNEFIEMIDEQEKKKEMASKLSNNELEKELKKLKKMIIENEERYKEEIQKLKDKLQSSQLSNDYFARGVYRLLSNDDEKNVLEGLQYLKYSSDEGNSHASYIRGLLYRKGIGIKQDFSKAIRYYERSSSQGNTYGLVELGLCYTFGLGVKQDYKKAIEYYKKGEELGNSYAMMFLGMRYMNGQGVEKDYSKTFEYCKKASDLGNLDAIDWIGVCYEQGIGVKQDYSEMIKYYEKVEKFGIKMAEVLKKIIPKQLNIMKKPLKQDTKMQKIV